MSCFNAGFSADSAAAQQTAFTTHSEPMIDSPDFKIKR